MPSHRTSPRFSPSRDPGRPAARGHTRHSRSPGPVHAARRRPGCDTHGTQHLWKAPWNAYKEIPAADAPHRNFWATAPGGHQQIGCIYTAQGLEYPYSGVIIGPDLVHHDGTWQPRPQFNRDRAMRNVHPHDYLRLALNIYHVLLTRGVHATRLYSADPKTQAFLNTLMPQP